MYVIKGQENLSNVAGEIMCALSTGVDSYVVEDEPVESENGMSFTMMVNGKAFKIEVSEV